MLSLKNSNSTLLRKFKYTLWQADHKEKKKGIFCHQLITGNLCLTVSIWDPELESKIKLWSHPMCGLYLHPPPPFQLLKKIRWIKLCLLTLWRERVLSCGKPFRTPGKKSYPVMRRHSDLRQLSCAALTILVFSRSSES